MTSKRISVTIDPIQHAASYQLAGEEIRRAIGLGIYLPGDRLPPTRELARQLGISVATLREAVRGLIDQGVLEMRRGPKGGLVVLPDAVKRVGGGRSRKVLLAEIETILEFRFAVEPYAARLAAERRDEADLEAMERAYEAMVHEVSTADDGLRGTRFLRADSDFHRAVGGASRNELLVHKIDEARAGMLAAAAAGLREITAHANDEHDAILREIRRGRPAAAEKAMVRHLEGTAADVTEMTKSRAASR